MAPSASLLDTALARFDPRQFTDEFLASLDIAEVNLACARGLAGAEDLDVDAALAKVDEWAETVRHATSRNVNAFTRDPARFDHSLGKFYMAVLCTTLQRDYRPTQPQHPWPYVARTPALPPMPGAPQDMAQLAARGHFGATTHVHSGFTELQHNMTALPGMPGFERAHSVAAMHGPLSLVSRRPPFPVHALPVATTPRLG